MKTIYLAGFDVFRKDAKSYGENLKVLCDLAGFEGRFPLDNDVPGHYSKSMQAEWIFQANLAMIQSADMVMANLNDFRGRGEPDSGTSFEVGYANALGKPVWGYRSGLSPLRDQLRRQWDDEGRYCELGYQIEDFGHPVNLMLACAARIIVGGPQECLEAMRLAQ